MLPFSLGACVISFCTGFLINAIGDVRQIMWASYVRLPIELAKEDNAHRYTHTLMTLGFGLMIMLTEASSM